MAWSMEERQLMERLMVVLATAWELVEDARQARERTRQSVARSRELRSRRPSRVAQSTAGHGGVPPPPYPGPVWIKVLGDYHCWPLWVREGQDEVFDTRDPATLGLTTGLVGRLAAWQQWYESTVNIADPNDSRPVTAVEREAFAAEGRLLAARVATELPHAQVWLSGDPQPGG